MSRYDIETAPETEANESAAPTAAPADDARRRRRAVGIGGKLFLAFGGVAALTLVAAGVAWLSYDHVDRQVQQALNRDVPAMTTALRLSSGSAGLAAAAPTLAAAPDAATREAVVADLSAKLQRLRDELTELRAAGGDAAHLETIGAEIDRLATELERLDTAVQGAHALLQASDAQVAALEEVQGALAGRLAILIDDASFDLVMRADEVTTDTGQAISTLMNREVGALRGALEVLAEVNLVGGLIAEAANTGDADSLPALRERLIGAVDRIDKSLGQMPDDFPGVEEARLLSLLLAEFGQGEQTVFSLREHWLGLSGWDMAERQLAEARLDALVADVLSVQKEMLQVLAPLVDEANFNVVLGSEQATGDASKAIGALMSDGVGQLRHLLEVRADVADLTNTMMRAASAPDVGYLGPLQQRFGLIRDRLAATLDELPASAETEELRERIATLAAFGEGDESAFAGRTEALAVHAEAEAALAAARQAASALDRQVADLVQAAQDEVATGAATVAAAIAQGRILLLALAAASLVVAGLVAWLYVGRSLLRRLRGLGEDMRRIAGGELGSAVTVRGRDELADMGAALESLRHDLAGAEAERARAEEERRATAAKRRQEMLELAGGFEQTVAQVVESLATASEGMQSTAQRMADAAQSATKRAAAVAGASQQTAGSVNAAASAAEQLAASISEIGRQVGQSTGIANQARQKVESTNEKVEGLAQAAEKIGAVVTLIQEIAEQTNLLALNATIEAARAGEAGKGFAVVASEVKSLASQTAKATEEIASQIGGMQSATKESVLAIQEIGKTILEMNEIAEAIAAAVTEQDAATDEIAGTVRQASAGTDEVNTNIAELTGTAEETGSAADAVLDAAGAMGEQTELLKTQVGEFLATVRAA